jgi:Fe-S cluster biogenesis protein NfuA/nitrite reductase/ring-hydroxylating ferredoxin subunit
VTVAGHSESVSKDLDGFVRDIQRHEDIFAGWDENQVHTVRTYRASIEALHKEAIRRLIKNLSGEPAAMQALKNALGDEVVYAVLRHFGIVKPSLQERLETALDSVRPMLASHGGDVELVSVTPPETAEIRFLGACDGCPASMLTFIAGVKKAIEEHCPEITDIKQARGFLNGNGVKSNGVQFVSPFALTHDGDWQFAAQLAAIPEGGILRVDLAGSDVFLSRNGHVVSCFENACAHLGMPIHDGEITDGILACPHHGFRYDLRSGECLTAPEVQLQSHAVRVIANKVEVRRAS